MLCKKSVLLLAMSVAVLSGVAQPTPDPHRVYTPLLDPREHPDYARRAVQPPTWDTFDNRTHFVAIRGFGVQDGNAVGYAEEMDKYVDQYRLGDVIWPSYDLIFAKNIGDVAAEIKRRNLYLFDIWGYVPGSGPGGYWQQFHPPAGVFEMLETTLGERWLGMDIGEQDGRYVGGYAPQAYPIATDRVQQYLHFQRHFDRMTTELGNKNATLVSLNFGHYFLKEGVYTCIGAETAQGLPNGQVYYSFIRGAGKQYGVPWFGNASVWNRWGWKTYEGEGDDHGPTKGTSLSLLKRLIYSHILYNCLFVGFESGWISGDGLTPIGRIQHAAVEWVETHGQPGTMLTPVALMTDFYAGWTFPRHLYTDKVYRVWGNLPYEAGDYLMDNVLDVIYPGYQDSSFFHNESGFLSATPYGDIADCVLSDAPLWLLTRYPLVIVAGELDGGDEIRDKLEGYVAQGGELIITSGNVAKWEGGFCGVTAAPDAERIDAGTIVGVDTEGAAFDIHRLALPADATVTASTGDVPLVARVPFGRGTVTVLASAFGVPAEPMVTSSIRSEIDAPLPTPFPLLAHARASVERSLAREALFTVKDGLSVITCRRGKGEYTLAIANSGLTPRPFAIESHCGPIARIEPLSLDDSEKGAAGYLPTGLDGTNVGVTDDATIAGGDLRIFRVYIEESDVEDIAHETPPARPHGRFLPLRNASSVEEAILARPTFFEHFDGVLVDWRYVEARSEEQLAHESGWLHRQSLRVVVDLTSGINLFPDLRLIDNDPVEYGASMRVLREVMAKAATLGARDLVLALHRVPENNFTREQTMKSFRDTLKTLCGEADTRGITLHLRQTLHGESLHALAALVREVGAANLRVAPAIALLRGSGEEPSAIAESLGATAGMVFASASASDVNGSAWTAQAPCDGAYAAQDLAPWLHAFADVPIALDGIYADANAEYRDIRLVERAE